MPVRSAFSFVHRIRLLLALILIALVPEAALVTLIPVGVYLFADGARIAHDRNSIYLMLSTLAAIVILGMLAGLLRDFLTARAQSRCMGRLRMVMFERVQRMSFAHYRQAVAGNPAEHFQRDFDFIEQAAIGAIPRAALPLMQALLSTGLIFWIEWRAGITALLFWPWIILAPALGTSREVGARKDLAEERDSLAALVTETLATLPVVRMFGLEQQGTTAFRKRSDALVQGSAGVNFRAAFMRRFTATGVLFLCLGLFAAGLLLVLGNSLTMGGFAAIQLSGLVMSHALLSLARYWPLAGQARKAWERMGEVLETPGAAKDTAGAIGLPPLGSEIGFADVAFVSVDTPEREGPEIASVTARIPRGAYVAFVGPSGEDKSTLLHLLMRYYDPDSGRITIDGHDLRSVTQTSLRSRMGLILPRNSLFNVSIRDNIRLGKQDASAEAVVTAATAVGLHDHIMGLPRAYDTIADASVRFSAAGRQRLAIARLLLLDPEILLLDQATSALDPTEEAAVLETIQMVRKGRTVIAAANRLSTIADADHIFVLDKGTITEQGNHADLIALDGMYAFMWRRQAGFPVLPDGAQMRPQRLRSFPVFENIPDAVLEELLPLFATETYLTGREIVQENDPGDKFYILARGQVESRDQPLLQDGDCFGELALLTGLPHIATVRALTPCTCLTLARNHFDGLLNRYPDLKRAMLETAVSMLREKTREPAREITKAATGAGA